MDDVDHDVARMWREMVYRKWGRRLGLLLAAVIMLILVALDAQAQPIPVPRAEDRVEIELRFKNAAGATMKLRKLPSEGYVVPGLGAAWYAHEEPCWNKTSPCVITSITIKTLYRLPTDTRYNWTGWWCTRNAAGECPMPAFEPVSVPVGRRLCIAYDRTKGAWTGVPSVCPDPVLPPPPPATGPSGAPASFVDSTGATWAMWPPEATCENGAGPYSFKKNGVAVGTGDEIRLCSGTIYGRAGANWYTPGASPACGGGTWSAAAPPC